MKTILKNRHVNEVIEKYDFQTIDRLNELVNQIQSTFHLKPKIWGEDIIGF